MIRRFLLLLLAILCLSGTRRGIVVVVVAERAESNLLRTHSTTANSHNPTTQHQYQQRHRELAASDWWYSLLNLLHVPCPDNRDSDRPAGHCAHPSHPSHSHVGGSGGGGDDDDDDDSSDDGTDAYAGDDDNSYWEGDDHDNDDGDDAWQGDGNDDEWQSNTLNNAGSISGSEGGGDNDGWAWGTAALLACAVGGAAFAVTRKRKRERGQRHLVRDTSDIPQDVYVRGDLSESNGRRSVSRGAGAGVVIDHDDDDCNDDDDVEMDERTYEGTVIVVDGCQGTVDDGDRPIVDRNDGDRPEEAADTATVKSSSRFGLISALSRRSRSGHGRGLKKKRSAFGLRSVRSMGRSRSTPAAENGNDGDDEDGDNATGNYRAPAPTTSPAIVAFSDEGATEVVVAREDGGAEL